MTEPTTAALAATTAAASSLAVIATALGVPAPVVLAAVLGAATAVATSGKLEFSRGALLAAFGAFAVALALGIWGGGLAGRLVIGLLGTLVPAGRFAEGMADPLCTFLVACLGQRELLPLGLRLLRNKVEGGAA